MLLQKNKEVGMSFISGCAPFLLKYIPFLVLIAAIRILYMKGELFYTILASTSLLIIFLYLVLQDIEIE